MAKSTVRRRSRRGRDTRLPLLLRELPRYTFLWPGRGRCAGEFKGVVVISCGALTVPRFDALQVPPKDFAFLVADGEDGMAVRLGEEREAHVERIRFNCLELEEALECTAKC